MDRGHVSELFEKLGTTNIKNNAEWIMSACPFAHYTHESGDDKRPSFGISLSAPSFYHCFGCSTKGPLSYFPTALAYYTKKDYSDLRRFILENENYNIKSYDSYDSNKKISAIPDNILDTFTKISDEILESVFMTRETATKYELLWDAKEERMLFPIRDNFDRLVTIRGRYMGKSSNVLKHKSYTELHPEGHDAKSFAIWYLMNEPLVPEKPLVLVEGYKDAILLKQVGVKNVWASLGSSIGKKQMEYLKKVTLPIIMFFDDDAAGRTATEKVAIAMNKLTPLYYIKNYYRCNDPAELIQRNRLKLALKTKGLFSFLEQKNT